MRDSNFEQPPSAADIARCAFGFGDDGAPLPGGFRVQPELAAAGLWTTPYDLALMVIGIVHSRAGRPGAFLNQALAIEMLKPGAGGAGLGTIIAMTKGCSGTTAATSASARSTSAIRSAAMEWPR